MNQSERRALRNLRVALVLSVALLILVMGARRAPAEVRRSVREETGAPSRMVPVEVPAEQVSEPVADATSVRVTAQMSGPVMEDRFLPKLRASLTRHEGRVLQAYPDVSGHAIGVGHHLSNGLPSELGISVADAMARGLTEAQVNLLLETDIEVAVTDTRNLCPWMESVPENRRVVLAEMSFILGRNKLARWNETLDAVRRGDFAEAARRMRNSTWATQAPNRVEDLAQIMESGVWPDGLH